MNRLVIIGNGFDLAHGLPTSYKDFIDDYWNSVSTKLMIDFSYEDLFCKFEMIALKLKFSSKELSKDDVKDFKSIKELFGKFRYDIKYSFKNNFFENTCNISSSSNWVDLENLYYDYLKLISRDNTTKVEKNRKISTLNEEFKQVKDLLEKYLLEKVVNTYKLDFTKNDDVEWSKFQNILKPISILSGELNIFKEFIDIEDVNEIKEYFAKERKEQLVSNIHILNFNYTPIPDIYNKLNEYDDSVNSSVNFIHGFLGNNTDNKVNFGFGDEMDEDYKLIENLNNNEFLRNFKSFQYLQNSNYNNLLRFVDSGKFQVLIMGHSCGLSDRTLLNTVFEHNNCRSIKVFFHQVKDENDLVIKDNYTEVVQNISRHFNKKKLMREKIVNKSLCQPMPQIKLPLK